MQQQETEQIRRIREMEAILNRAGETMKELLPALDKLEALLPEIRRLIDYYESDAWWEDFRDEEEGNLPKDLKRGVLSEDGIYDLLTDYVSAMEAMAALAAHKDE